MKPRAAPSSEHTCAVDRCHQEPPRLLLDLLLLPSSPAPSRVPCRQPCDLASSASLEEDDLNIKSPLLSRASALTSASPSPADDRGRTPQLRAERRPVPRPPRRVLRQVPVAALCFPYIELGSIQSGALTAPAARCCRVGLRSAKSPSPVGLPLLLVRLGPCSSNVAIVRIRSTAPVRLLHGLVLLPSGISVAGTGYAMIMTRERCLLALSSSSASSIRG